MNNSDEIVFTGRSSFGWDANQTVPLLRPPRDASDSEQTAEASSAQGSSSDISSHGAGDGHPILSKSRLSADAKEFVPRSAQIQAQPQLPIPDYGALALDASLENCILNELPPVPAETHVSLPQSSYYPRSKSSQQSRLTRYQTPNGAETQENSEVHDEVSTDYTAAVVKRLHEFMQEITIKPGRFAALGKMFVDESISWLGDSNVVCAIVDALISQAIVERNFQYNGARLCSLLAESDNTGNSVFKLHLLGRVQREYNQLYSSEQPEPSRLYGFIGFLSELHTQMGNDSSLQVLGDYLLNMLDTLVSFPTVDNVKRACQYLKLAGRMLDKRNKEKMDALMTKLGNAGYPTNTTHIVASVMSLRSQNWGMDVDDGPKSSASDSFQLSSQPCLQSEAIQYGPDGLALSKEERDFLQASSNVHSSPVETEEGDDFGDEYEPYDDEMDEEIEKGYVEFLMETKQI